MLKQLKKEAGSQEALDNIDLFTKLAELQTFYQNQIILNNFLSIKKQNEIVVVDQTPRIDPKAKQLQNSLEILISENRVLCKEIMNKGHRLMNSLNN